MHCIHAFINAYPDGYGSPSGYFENEVCINKNTELQNEWPDDEDEDIFD